MRKLTLTDAVIEFEFRLEGKANFAGIIFNGSQERGHILHLVMAKDRIKILGHPKKGENVELLNQEHSLAAGVWHRVKLELRGEMLSVTLNSTSISTKAPFIAESKISFGLGGDSGGPEGEKAGALEFRNLKITTP
jgi:hypothetical protein